ncbi:fic family toxin-antitoxin system, toxin component [Streptomyces sp. SID8379]|uniref:fic family toxin-antitoxin system, toxin component n=1 Tax=unclassified Streptomyces TaxID=2593676 RepID=UPI001319F279|nr:MULTISPECIES: fic family toxin-antitoxin system, toxin component [unclassified Streptomyces]MYW68462.1 fic family toxin-antitoxin system, toxin component [Streptomyces sp. SID8379]
MELPQLLTVAETLPRDPQIDDLGILTAACDRAFAVALEREVYPTLRYKAAALLEQLARHDALEHSNLQFAWLAVCEFARLNGYRLDAEPKDARDLVVGIRAYEVDVRDAARAISSWWEPVG